MGKLKDTERILSASDLFLLTSESESFGLAALEAMAAKVPVISSNTGGIRVNKHSFSGYLSNVGDIDDMAANALKILSDDAVLEQFKQNAYQQAKQFDIEKILPQYEAIYKELIGR